MHVRKEDELKTLAYQRYPWGTIITNRVGDRLARQLRKMGATVDLERTAPQRTTTTQDENGNSRSKFAQIYIVVTIPGRDEL